MELDHDSGRMDGMVLSGRFSGCTLSSLSDTETIELLDELHAEGAQEAALIEAYLDWRLPGWRDRRTRPDRARPGRARPGRAATA